MRKSLVGFLSVGPGLALLLLSSEALASLGEGGPPGSLLAVIFIGSVLIPGIFAFFAWRIAKRSRFLESHIRKIEDRNRVLEEKSADLKEFTIALTHDLRHPLQHVSGFLGLLKKDCADQLDDRAMEYIDVAIAGTKRMANLTQGLLDYSHIEGQVIDIEVVDLSETMGEVIRDLSARLEEVGAKITVVGTLPMVWGTESLLYQVLQNLITNAIKYRRKGVPLKVRVEHEARKGEWVLRVEDNGIGIAEKDIDPVFKLLHRVHSDASYEGSGIGLAVSKRIIERHGGRIWVESELGKGSTFFVVLPAPDQSRFPER